ncbi:MULTISPECIES: metal-dependent hydrolase [Alteribacter]|nr:MULTISPECIES: metal-dependent hydrolase [Alteribacter]MBM7094528.1 metal-dependent hydrolase [Alteribacter salitolerans]
MRYDTHLATTIAAGSGICFFQQDTSFTTVYITGLIAGSLLPDIDEPSSFLGRRLTFISRPVKRIFGHRGITHSVLTWMILAYLLSPFEHPFLTGLLIGYAVHLAGDLFSSRSIPLFAPFSSFRLKMPVTYKTSGLAENIILFISVVISIVFIQQGELIVDILQGPGIQTLIFP